MAPLVQNTVPEFDIIPVFKKLCYFAFSTEEAANEKRTKDLDKYLDDEVVFPAGTLKPAKDHAIGRILTTFRHAGLITSTTDGKICVKRVVPGDCVSFSFDQLLSRSYLKDDVFLLHVILKKLSAHKAEPLSMFLLHDSVTEFVGRETPGFDATFRKFLIILKEYNIISEDDCYRVRLQL